MQNNPFATANYLVPLDGTTHTVVANFVASVTPYKINWSSFSNDNFSFWPQGAYVDNSAGIGDLTIKISPIGFTVTIPAGATRVVGWPAPKNQTCEITGNGAVAIFFVNYPVLGQPPEVDGKLLVSPTTGGIVAISGQPISISLSQYTPLIPALAQVPTLGVPTTSQLMDFDGTAWNPVQPPAPAVNSVLTGLTTAAAGVENITLDLGTQYQNYKQVSIGVEGIADAANAINGYGSNDNVTWFALSSITHTGNVFAINGGILNDTGLSVGFRYVRVLFQNGATAQAAATLYIGAQ